MTSEAEAQRVSKSAAAVHRREFGAGEDGERVKGWPRPYIWSRLYE
jgi:hypothetical protein